MKKRGLFVVCCLAICMSTTSPPRNQNEANGRGNKALILLGYAATLTGKFLGGLATANTRQAASSFPDNFGKLATISK